MTEKLGSKIDHVDDIRFDVDEGGGYLVLFGDFVGSCEEYLADSDLEGITFKINVSQAEEIVKQISDYLP